MGAAPSELRGCVAPKVHGVSAGCSVREQKAVSQHRKRLPEQRLLQPEGRCPGLGGVSLLAFSCVQAERFHEMSLRQKLDCWKEAVLQVRYVMDKAVQPCLQTDSSQIWWFICPHSCLAPNDNCVP